MLGFLELVKTCATFRNQRTAYRDQRAAKSVQNKRKI